MVNILFPVFTVAPWGGLQENAVLAAKGLVSRGHSVSAVVRSGKVADEMRSAGARVHVVSWDEDCDPRAILGDFFGSFDLVFATPQKSREFALKYSALTKTPVFVQFHGHYADQVAYWENEVERFSAVSGCLEELLTGYSRISPWRVHSLPNGIPDEVVDLGRQRLVAPALDHPLRVVTASRLESDKSHQWKLLERTLHKLKDRTSEVITVRVLGDGSNRVDIENSLKQKFFDFPNVKFDFLGWVDSDTVVEELSSATLSVGAGRSALLSLGVGTPVLAAGRSGAIGLATGRSLDLAAWSSFGDNPIYDAHLRRQGATVGLDFLFDADLYRSVQKEGWSFVDGERRQSVIDRKTAGFLKVD